MGCHNLRICTKIRQYVHDNVEWPPRRGAVPRLDVELACEFKDYFKANFNCEKRAASSAFNLRGRPRSQRSADGTAMRDAISSFFETFNGGQLSGLF